MSLQNDNTCIDCLRLMKDGGIVFDQAGNNDFTVAGIKPLEHFVLLPPMDSGETFLENSEAAIFNIGGKGMVGADGAIYEMDAFDCTYLGKGTTDVKFFSVNEQDPAMFVLISVKADLSYPNHLIPKTGAITTDTKMKGQGNLQVYIMPGGLQSCRLQMGTGTVADPKVMNGRELLPISSLLLYYLNADQASFIWASTSCEELTKKISN